MTEALVLTKDDTRRNARNWVLALVFPLAILISALLVLTASFSAFTATTETHNNTFSTGTVTLTNDHTDTAVFAATGLVPGATGTQPVLVTYNGTVPVNVRLYATMTPGSPQALAQHINLSISDGTNTWAGTLAQFQTLTDFANGILPNGMSTTAATKTYTFTYTVLTTAVQATDASVVFVWEAQTQ